MILHTQIHTDYRLQRHAERKRETETETERSEMGDNLFEGLPPPSQQKPQQQQEDKKQQQQQQQQQRHNTTTSSSSSSFSSPVPPPIPILKSALKRPKPKPTEPFPEPEGYYSFFPHFVVWNCFAFCFQNPILGCLVRIFKSN